MRAGLCMASVIFGFAIVLAVPGATLADQDQGGGAPHPRARHNLAKKASKWGLSEGEAIARAHGAGVTSLQGAVDKYLHGESPESSFSGGGSENASSEEPVINTAVAVPQVETAANSPTGPTAVATTSTTTTNPSNGGASPTPVASGLAKPPGGTPGAPGAEETGMGPGGGVTVAHGGTSQGGAPRGITGVAIATPKSLPFAGSVEPDRRQALALVGGLLLAAFGLGVRRGAGKAS